MATLPDGDTVNKEFGPESWEDISVTFPDKKFPTEGWEIPVRVLERMDISAGDRTPSIGERVEVTATIENGKGAIEGFPLDVMVDGDREANVRTDQNGKAKYTLGPDNTGNVLVTFKNENALKVRKIANQDKESWEDLGLPFAKQFGPERWEL